MTFKPRTRESGWSADAMKWAADRCEPIPFAKTCSESAAWASAEIAGKERSVVKTARITVTVPNKSDGDGDRDAP